MDRPAAAALRLQVQRPACAGGRAAAPARRARPAAALALLVLPALLALLALLATAASAAGGRGSVPLEDLLRIVVTPRALLAIDAESGGDTREDLELGETVRWRQSRGRVGVVLTDRRVLAVGTGSGAWQDTRYRRGESPPGEAALGDRVALVATDRRVLGFDGGSFNLVEQSIGPNERVLHGRVSANLAVVVTDRRALALSPFVGGFFETRLRVAEEIESVDLGSDVATLTTSDRLLVFRGRDGSWSERHIELR